MVSLRDSGGRVGCRWYPCIATGEKIIGGVTMVVEGGRVVLQVVT